MQRYFIYAPSRHYASTRNFFFKVHHIINPQTVLHMSLIRQKLSGFCRVRKAKIQRFEAGNENGSSTVSNNKKDALSQKSSLLAYNAWKMIADDSYHSHASVLGCSAFRFDHPLHPAWHWRIETARVFGPQTIPDLLHDFLDPGDGSWLALC